MRRVLLLAALLPLLGCAPKTHIRSTIGEVAPTAINLTPWRYVRTNRTLSLQWARLGPPLWVRRSADGGMEAIGVIVERSVIPSSAEYAYFYRPGRTHLVAVSYAPDGRLRRPPAALRDDMHEMARSLRRVAW